MRNRLQFIILIAFIIIGFPLSHVQKDCFSAYRVVIDPGHGGIFHKNKDKYGDRYDVISKKYLSYFAEGAHYKGLYEHKIVYSIAKKVEKLLSHCSESGDFSKFKKILNKYSKSDHKKIIIETKMSRKASVERAAAKKISDPNGPYRLYDFPDKKGELLKGRISKINQFKPHLVVSIHCAKTAPPDYVGMNAVVVPPYNVLKNGLDNLKKGNIVSPSSSWSMNSWFRGRRGMSRKRAFYEDVVLYFTGFGLQRNYKTDRDNFRGYRYNMVHWNYADKENWFKKAKEHKKNTRYGEYKYFKPEGKIWARESSKYEGYRRGTGFNDFGGDNYYASNEILKYIFTSLSKKGYKSKKKYAGKPFVSVWSVPLLVNAISAYIEIGYFDRKWDRKVMTRRHDEIAEGIAVGIYSLFAGMKDVKSPEYIKPKGKSIDFEKYQIGKDKTYFDLVVN